MIFGRVKPLDAILATAEKKGLQRSLGAFQLTMLGIGAVIGTGIFVMALGGTGIWYGLYTQEEKFDTYEELSASSAPGLEVYVGPGFVTGTF